MVARKSALTKSQRMAKDKLSELLWRSQLEANISSVLRDEVPDAWHLIEADLDCHAAKQKVTLYLDAPVAKAFKAMGKGYQARINRILATWTEMKIGHVMEAEKIMLEDRRRAIMDAEKAEGSETAGRGWGEYVEGDRDG